LNGFWANAAFSGEFSTFIFKLLNNRLGYNHVVSKFVRGISENCTFCELARHDEHNRETPLHLFYDCEIVDRIRENFFAWLLLGTGERNPTRQEIFVTFERDNNFFNRVMTLVSKLYLFIIWQCKVRKTLPTLNLLKFSVINELQVIAYLSNDLKLGIKESRIRRLQNLDVNILALELEQ